MEGKRRIYYYILHLSNNTDNIQDASPAMFHCLAMQMQLHVQLDDMPPH